MRKESPKEQPKSSRGFVGFTPQKPKIEEKKASPVSDLGFGIQG